MGTNADDHAAIIAALTNRARNHPDLTEQVQDFCVHYVIEGVGTKAARAAGFSPGYVGQAPVKWLRDRRAVALIAELRALLPDVRPVDPNAVQSRLAMLALTDVADLLVPDEAFPDQDPPALRWKRPDELTPGERALVQDVFVSDDVQEDEYGNKRNKQHFRYKVLGQKDALDSLARTFGMFRDKVEHEHRHKIDALFQFIASTPETSETVAILNRRYGRNVIEGESTPISHNGPDSDPSP